MTFRRTYPLRFAHCDPAGIAYYPKLFELCDAAIEDWSADVLGVPRRVMHLELDLALPTVTLEAEFNAVSRLGDLLDIALDVTALGTASINLRAEVSCAGERRFAIRYRQVLMRMQTNAAEPWPAEWRARMEGEVRP